MTIGDYIRLNKRWLLHNGCLLVVVNLVLIAGSPLGYEREKFSYFNLLLICLQMSLLVWDYLKVKGNFKHIQKDIETEDALRQIHFVEDNYYTELIEQIIEKLNKENEQSRLEYEKRADQIEEYITEWVHDIKVKVAVCDLVLEDLEDEETVERLAPPLEQIKFMVGQLLYITRANHYSQDLHVEYVDLMEVVKGRIKENAPFFINKDITIENKLVPATFLADKKWLEYIIGQVLNNASKYTKQGGKVLIYTKEDEWAVHLHIKDNGVGIPSEEVKRIFDKGFTGTNGRLTTKSTGMGLYYAKKMANALSIGLCAEAVQNEYTDMILSFYKLEDYFKVTKM